MAKDEMIEKFYSRFKDYNKPSKLQVEFLDYYKRKDTLTELENKKMLATVRALENIDKLNYQKKVKRNLDKAEKAEQRKELTHLQIIAGAALLKALGSNSKSKQSYIASFDNLISENFIDEADAKKLKDFLARNTSSKSEDFQVSKLDVNTGFNETAISNIDAGNNESTEFYQALPQQSMLPLDSSDTSQ